MAPAAQRGFIRFVDAQVEALAVVVAQRQAQHAPFDAEVAAR
jgi:hypothetical protein